MRRVLREYQSKCRDRVLDDIKSGHQKLLVIMPTGSGKTEVFAHIIKGYIAGTDKKAVVVSHLGLLTSQTSVRFENDHNIKTGILQASVYPNANDRCIITTMQSFRVESKVDAYARKCNKMNADWLVEDSLNIGLIIIDETHFLGSDSYDKILAQFPNAIVIGFTATPFRENKLMSNLFDKVSYTISTQELIDQRWLVPPVLHGFEHDAEDQADTLGKILKIYREKHEGDKAVIFCKSIEQAIDARMLFSNAGYQCDAVTSKVSGIARDDILKKFAESNNLNVLTTVDVLTAGFDSPRLSVIFMPYQTKSVVKYLQRIGRGLRLSEGKNRCDIYVGGSDPELDKGFWEKIQKQAVGAGHPDTDTYTEDWELYKDIMTTARYEWTAQVVAMVKGIQKRGLVALGEMVNKKEFPKALLQDFVDIPPYAPSRSARATPKQVIAVGNILRMQPHSHLTKAEAGAIIRSFKRTQGFYKEWEIVKQGKHKDKLFEEIPYTYWNILKIKAPTSLVYQGYINYLKERTKCQR